MNQGVSYEVERCSKFVNYSLAVKESLSGWLDHCLPGGSNHSVV